MEAEAEHGSYRQAAKALGQNDRSFHRKLQRARAAAAKAGWAPGSGLDRPVAEGFSLKGYSTLGRNADGEPTWYKANRDAEALEALQRAALDAFSENIRPVKPHRQNRKATDSDLLNLYVVTDYHLGARSWPEETGEDWDTDIAEDLLVRWFQRSIEQSPQAETAILAQLGDFLDHDGLIPVTPTSGHVMDADTRYQKLVRVAIRVLRKVVGMLLDKHQRVHVIMAEGNHDMSSSAWLREGFHALYENEPRVTIDRSPDIYYCYEHGQSSIFFHHGHKRRPKDIDAVFAAKFRDVFGRTSHSYAHLGHLHHVDIKETSLMLVEQHRTLAARNAHESRGGWISGRDAKVVTYHKEFGRVAEQVISPEMV